MANYKTGVQRRNDRMFAIFDRAKSEGRGLVGNSKTPGMGVNSLAMKKAIHAKMGYKNKNKN